MQSDSSNCDRASDAAASVTAVIEIVAHTIRLCRSGNYRRGRSIIEQLARDFPDVAPEAIRLSALEAAPLMKAQLAD